MKENKNFWREVAKCKELKGNDLRLLMLCVNRELTQTDVREEMGWNKPNTSIAINKLYRMGLLELREAHGAKWYRTNRAWKNDQCEGQLTL